MHFVLPNTAKTRRLGKALAECAPSVPFIITLAGNLGAGKSCLARAFLKKLGVNDPIPSPTYTICETYSLSEELTICHIDLYRLEDPEELEMLGFRDMIEDQGILIEWPERAGSFLPIPDIDINLMWQEDGRMCTLGARSEKGNAWLSELEWSSI